MWVPEIKAGRAIVGALPLSYSPERPTGFEPAPPA